MSRPSSRAGHPFMEGDWYGRRMMYPSDVMDASMSMPTFYPYAPLASPYTPAAAHPAAGFYLLELSNTYFLKMAQNFWPTLFHL